MQVTTDDGIAVAMVRCRNDGDGDDENDGDSDDDGVRCGDDNGDDGRMMIEVLIPSDNSDDVTMVTMMISVMMIFWAVMVMMT
jgi:hypothetical protein